MQHSISERILKIVLLVFELIRYKIQISSLYNISIDIDYRIIQCEVKGVVASLTNKYVFKILP